MGCFGVSKCLLIFFNVVLFLVGSTLTAAGLVGSTLTAAGIYLKVAGIPSGLDLVSELLSELHLNTSAYILIGVGATMFAISLIGCVGASKESTCLISTYLVMLLVLLLAQAGMVGYLFVNRSTFASDEEFVVEFMKKNFVGKKLGDNFERDFKCCGLDRLQVCNAPTSGNNSTLGGVTEGCRCLNGTEGCKTLAQLNTTCEVGDGFQPSDYIYTQSCPTKMLKFIGEVKDSKMALGLGIGAAALQLLGLIFSCIICHRIRTTGEAFNDDLL